MTAPDTTATTLATGTITTMIMIMIMTALDIADRRPPDTI
jgi:hypothetical protein